MNMWEKAQRLQRIATYWQRSEQCYRDGFFLTSSRWARLAEYERDRLNVELGRA